MTSWWTGKKFSEEHRNKLSKAAKGRIGYWKGKKFSKAHRKHLSLALKGRKISSTHRKNVSKGISKWWSNPDNKKRMSEAKK